MPVTGGGGSSSASSSMPMPCGRRVRIRPVGHGGRAARPGHARRDEDAGLAPQRLRRDLPLRGVRRHRPVTVRAWRTRRDGLASAAASDVSTTAPWPIATVTGRSPTTDVHCPPGHQRTARRAELERAGAGGDRHAADPERERLAEPAGEEEALGGVEVRVRVHVGAVPWMHLEVEVVVPLRVAGVAVPGDLLARRHLRAVLDRVRRAELAAAAILGALGQVVVEVDVEVRRAAAAVEVEHAAGTRRGRVPPHPARLRRDDGRAPRDVLDVDAGVTAVDAGVAVVHRVRVVADQREDDRLAVDEAGFRSRARGRDDGRSEESGQEEEKAPSCCRPVASHGSGAARRRAGHYHLVRQAASLTGAGGVPHAGGAVRAAAREGAWLESRP